MAAPQLTFFCELDAPELSTLMTDELLAQLAAMKARVSLGLRDLSAERARVVQRMNAAGVPVIAWLLLPEEQGYWFNQDNGPQAAASYVEFRSWTAQYNLRWAGVGLDIEPALDEMRGFRRNWWRRLPTWVGRALNGGRQKRAHAIYARLASEIRADGYFLESYQFPIIEDERRAGSSLLRRVIGLVDVPVDREVWMLYSSFFPPEMGGMAAGFVSSYAADAQAVALGSTGGGVVVTDQPLAEMSWSDLERDLRLAWYWHDQIYIFSLEGCVRRGFLPRLKTFAWDQPILLPEDQLRRVEGWRASLSTALWASTYLNVLLISAGVMLLAIYYWRRRNEK